MEKIREVGHAVITTGIETQNISKCNKEVLHKFIDNTSDNIAVMGKTLTVDSILECAREDIIILTKIFNFGLDADIFAKIITLWLFIITVVGTESE